MKNLKKHLAVLLLLAVCQLTVHGYTNYSQSWPYTDFIYPVSGGGSNVNLTITNDVLTLTFSAGFNSTTMRVGNIKLLSTSPQLPNMELGNITANYYAKISNGYLHIYAIGTPAAITGFSKVLSSANQNYKWVRNILMVSDACPK